MDPQHWLRLVKLFACLPIILALYLELVDDSDGRQVAVLGDGDDGKRIKGQHHLVRDPVLLPIRIHVRL
jgi:hypothetical protein